MRSLFAAFALAAASAAASAAPPAPAPAAAPEEARIPFVSFGGVRDFDAVSDDTVYLQDRGRRWYRAQLFGPCFGLRNAVRIGLDTRGSSAVDRFSAILVRGERCQISSLTRSEGPPKKAKKAKRG